MICERDGCRNEELIAYDDTPCFAVRRLTLTSTQMILEQAPAVYVVTQGSGLVLCGGQSWSVKKGAYFFLPYAAGGKTAVRTSATLQLVACLPPATGREDGD